jgi:hypothetical protein
MGSLRLGNTVMRLINSRRSRGGVAVDEFELDEGGRLLAPLVLQWEIEAKRQALRAAERQRQHGRLDEPPPAP